MHDLIDAIAAGESGIAQRLAARPGAAAARMTQDLLVEAIPHWLYAGDTLLHLAAAALNVDAAAALLDAGADVMAVGRRGTAPLHYACDPRPTTETAWNPAQQVRVIELLIARGASVDAQDKGGVTPLLRAVRSRSPVAVRALLDAGADPRLANHSKTGSTPLSLAKTSSGAGGTAGAGALQREIIALLSAALHEPPGGLGAEAAKA